MSPTYVIICGKVLQLHDFLDAFGQKPVALGIRMQAVGEEFGTEGAVSVQYGRG